MAKLKYAIAGHPLGFCLTTPVMNGAFKKVDVDAEFETLNLPPEGLTDLIERLRSGELAGAVMATPHKTPASRIWTKLKTP